VLKSSQIIESAIRARTAPAGPPSTQPNPEVITQIRNGLTVVASKTPAGQGNLFKLSYRSSDADDCRVVLAALLASYKESLEKKHEAVAGDTVELIVHEQENVRKELAAQESEYRSFREKAPLLGKSRDGLELRQEGLRNIQAKRSALLLQKVEVEGQIAAVELALKEGRTQEAILVMLAEFARKSDAAEPGATKPKSPEEQLLPLLLEEQKLLRTKGAKTPEVLAIREQIETARRLLLLPAAAWKSDAATDPGKPGAASDPIRAHVEFLRQKLAHQKITDDLLAAAFEKEQDEARHLASYEIQNEAFQTGIGLKRQMYEALVKRLNEASLIKNAGGYQVDVIEPPSVGRSVAPSLPLYVCVGAFLGLAGGLLASRWMNGRHERPTGGAAPRPVRSRAVLGRVLPADPATATANHTAVPSEVVA
jgi:uncharacterized protein involved in exopolysaccharide biosynthesis